MYYVALLFLLLKNKEQVVSKLENRWSRNNTYENKHVRLYDTRPISG